MCALILTSLSSSESSTDSLMLEDSDHTTPLKWNGGAVVRANFKWSAISALVKDVKEPVSTTTFTDTYLANILTSQLLLTSGWESDTTGAKVTVSLRVCLEYLMLVARLVGRAFTVTMERFVIVETQASIYTLLARKVTYPSVVFIRRGFMRSISSPFSARLVDCSNRGARIRRVIQRERIHSSSHGNISIHIVINEAREKTVGDGNCFTGSFHGSLNSNWTG